MLWIWNSQNRKGWKVKKKKFFSASTEKSKIMFRLLTDYFSNYLLRLFFKGFWAKKRVKNQKLRDKIVGSFKNTKTVEGQNFDIFRSYFWAVKFLDYEDFSRKWFRGHSKTFKASLRKHGFIKSTITILRLFGLGNWSIFQQTFEFLLILFHFVFSRWNRWGLIVSRLFTHFFNSFFASFILCALKYLRYH